MNGVMEIWKITFKRSDYFEYDGKRMDINLLQTKLSNLSTIKFFPAKYRLNGGAKYKLTQEISDLISEAIENEYKEKMEEILHKMDVLTEEQMDKFTMLIGRECMGKFFYRYLALVVDDLDTYKEVFEERLEIFKNIERRLEEELKEELNCKPI
jgi:hypothetical protein